MSSVRAACTTETITSTHLHHYTDSPTRPSHSPSSLDGRSSDPDKMLQSAVDGGLESTAGPSTSVSTGDQPPEQCGDAAAAADTAPSADDPQQWSEEDTQDLKRVKVYELIGARWVDQGTAFCFGDFQDNEALLIARAEADFNHIILSTTIRSNDVYQRQQDTLIVWTEPDGVDYALSFQDAEGCAEVWNFIQEVQRHMITADQGLSSSPMVGPEPSITTASIIRSGHLPPPALGIITEIERAIKTLTRTPAFKERVCEYIQNEDYIKALIDVMHQAEDLENLENLHALCSCMQTILMLNDHGMYEHILEDDIFFGVVGMLEYDPEFPTHKANYREFLREASRFHQPVPIRDEATQKKIHHTYRLQFLKDVVLARAIDDSTFNVLNSCIIFNQIDIINHVQNDPAFLREVVGMFMDEELLSGLGMGKAPEKKEQAEAAKEGGEKMDVDRSCETKPNGVSQPKHPVVKVKEEEEDVHRRREVVYLIQQLCVMGKNVQLPARMALFRTLSDRGILFAVQWAMDQPEHDEDGRQLISAAGEVLTSLLDHDVAGVRNHVVKQVSVIEKDKEMGKKGAEKETVLAMLCRVLVRSRDMAVQSQIGEALRVLMEIPQGDAADAQPVMGAKLFQRAKDDPGIEKFLDYFYKQCVETLFKPLFDIPDFKNLTEPTLTLTRERTNLYLQLSELLANFALQHSFRSHFYMLSSNVSSRVASLFRARDKHLRLAAFRYFRVLLRLNNRNIFNHLIKHDVLKPILDLALQESRRDNLLSSSCQEFFEHMRRENVKDLIHHCMTKHEATVRALAETQLGGPQFKSFIRRWEMNVEPPPKEEAQAAEKATPNGARRWGQGQLMEAEEEDYFNADDDEEDDKDDGQIAPVFSAPLIAKGSSSLKRKRPSRGGGVPQRPSRPPPPMSLRTPPLGSLVDYDDGDDVTAFSPSDADAPSSPSAPPTSASSQKPSSDSPASPRTASSRQTPLATPPSHPASSPEEDEDSLLEALVSKGGPASPAPAPVSIKPPELKRRREDDDDELLERLATKAKRPSIHIGKESVRAAAAAGAAAAASAHGGKAAPAARPGEDGGPKKIKFKLASPAPLTPSQSGPGAKDGDTG